MSEQSATDQVVFGSWRVCQMLQEIGTAVRTPAPPRRLRNEDILQGILNFFNNR